MTIRWKVALVEDDRRLARAVSAGLGDEGYTVRSVDSADRGLQLVRKWNPDVVLLDLMLPDNDGPELFQAFRAETDAALVGISAKASVSDRIAGLKLGADDYVGKPFALEELMARVEAVIRRHRGNGGSRLVVGDFSLDFSEGVAERGGRGLGLTRIVPAALMAAALLLAGEATASANCEWCVYDPPIQVVTPGGHIVTVNNTIYLPPYERHLASHFTATATAVSNGHGGTHITVRVQIASGITSAHVVSSVNRFQVTSAGGGAGGTVVTTDLDVPAA